MFAPDHAEMYPRAAAGHRRPGADGAGARRQVTAGLLQRRADRGAEAVPAGPARRRGIRREGRAAAGAGPPDDRRLRARRQRSFRSPWSATPTAWPSPAGTPTCPGRRAHRCARAPRALLAGQEQAPAGRAGALAAARAVLAASAAAAPPLLTDYLALVDPVTFDEVAELTTEDRPSCWSPARPDRPG